jgi:hypothetical protein
MKEEQVAAGSQYNRPSSRYMGDKGELVDSVSSALAARP